MSKRMRHVWPSQRALLQAWFAQLAPRHTGDTVIRTGRCRSWSVQTTLSFEDTLLYSHDWSWDSEQERWLDGIPTALAQLVQLRDKRWLVAVRHPEVRSRAYKWRMDSVFAAAADSAALPCVRVPSLEAPHTHAAWHTARVLMRYGYWKWSRTYRSWRFQQLEHAIKEREQYERVFGLPATKEEADVRCAQVTQRLTASVTQ